MTLATSLVSRSSTIITTLLLVAVVVLLLFLAVDRANAQDVPKSQATPEATARTAFEAFKRQDIPAFVALFHPDEFKRFKKFAVDVFKYEDQDDAGIKQLRGLFAPHESLESVSSATGSDLLECFLKNGFVLLSEGLDLKEILADAKVQVLGTIEEGPDKVHVITRTVLPRPSPVSCRKSDGRWYQLLNDETMRMISAFERIKHFKGKDVSIESLTEGLKIEKIDVLGHVKDGDDTAQVLCRTTAKFEDFPILSFGCYPVRKEDPAWDHLDDEDKSRLVEAMREKWGE